MVGRINLIERHMCDLSMDRNRIFWPKERWPFFRYAVLKGIAAAVGQIFEAVEHLSITPDIRRQLEHTVASFFELPTIDDVLFEALHPDIRQILRLRFRSMLRASISKTDSPGQGLSTIAAEHGFRYLWQKAVIAAMVQ